MKTVPRQNDEKVLWEGKPDTQLRFGIETLATGIFASALVLACLGLATVINRSNPGTYWGILAPGLMLGAIIVLAYPVLDSSKRKRTLYRLTTQHAIIEGPTYSGTYPIPPLDDLIYRNGTPPSIYFARRGPPRRMYDIGFERIADAKEVFIQMRTQAQELHP